MRVRSSTFECIALGLAVLALWGLLAGEFTLPSLASGCTVALAAAAWGRLIDG